MDQGVTGVLYQICIWIMRLIYVNILWIAFTILGLFVLGIAPATTALFAVTRKWLMGEKEIDIFPTFWESYRNEFVTSNILLGILLVVGVVLYIDYRILVDLEGQIYTILLVGLLGLGLIYIFIFLFIFPVLAHYKLKTFQYLRQTFLIVISNPFRMLLTTVSIVLLMFILYKVPGLIPFYAGSFMSMMIMYVATTIFKKIDKQVISE